MMHFIKKVVRELDSSAADFKAYKRYTKEGRHTRSLARHSPRLSEDGSWLLHVFFCAAPASSFFHLRTLKIVAFGTTCALTAAVVVILTD